MPWLFMIFHFRWLRTCPVNLSFHNACENGWFSYKDNEDLRSLANEIGSAFCSTRDINTEASSFLHTVLSIMLRFYPQIRMGQILAFVKAKPGYDAYVIDFHILKNLNTSPEDKIRLFVAQTDNMETSSCIISPQRVSFLLNGKGVDRRTNVFMDTGPQVPTNVTHMLKYGTNLLQAVGQFNGNYIVVVAFMSMTTTPIRPALQDYVQPAVAALDSDSEIIEGPSRISLNCPISFRHIKTPVKGHSCKHLQCFDFDNYVDINSRRPSWRCPHCNQSVCFTDIRIDQNMVKVLEEVGENVADVIISADGSWKAVIESNDQRDKHHDRSPNCNPNVLSQQESTSISNAPPEILDLTEGDDEIDAVGTCEHEDRKPFWDNFQSQSRVNNPTIIPSHIEDEFWQGIYLSTYGQGTSSPRLDTQNYSGVSEPAPTNHMLSPVLSDAITPALNREPEAFRGTALATSVVQNQFSAPSSVQLQQFGNSIMSNEYGRSPSISRHINRTPVAVQALPAQTQTSIAQQRSRMASQTSPALPLHADGSSTVFSNLDRQLQSRSDFNLLQGPYMSSSSLQQHIGLQNWGHQGHSLISSQPAQQINGLPAPSQLPSGYQVSPVLPTNRQNSHQQQAISQRMPHARSQSPSLIQSSTHFPQAQTHFPQAQTHQGGMQNRVTPTPVTGSQQNRFVAAAQRQMQRMQSPSPSVPVQTPRTSSSFPVNVEGNRPLVGGYTGGTVQPVTRPDVLVDSSAAEQNWRPSGRMRGSLSGQAYSAALNQYIIQPTQPVQPVMPLANLTTPPSGIPSPLHVLMANSRNSHATQAVNHPSTERASSAGISGVLPEQSSGMH